MLPPGLGGAVSLSSKAMAPAWPAAWHPGFDTNPSWFTWHEEQQVWRCELCNACATTEHVASRKHEMRAQNPHEYGCANAEGVLPPALEEVYYYWAEDGYQHCKLCKKQPRVTEEHVKGWQHCQRAQDAGWWLQEHGFAAARLRQRRHSRAGRPGRFLRLQQRHSHHHHGATGRVCRHRRLQQRHSHHHHGATNGAAGRVGRHRRRRSRRSRRMRGC